MVRSPTMLRILLVLSIAGAVSPLAAATPPAQEASAAEPTGRLVVDVRDALGGALPGATVSVTGLQPPSPPVVLVTDSAGRSDTPELAPGRYHVVVELPGFEAAALDDVIVQRGRSTPRVVTLGLATFAEQVTVRVDPIGRQLEDTFTETLSAEELDQLPDDPDDAYALLDELAGPGAEFRVNGFEGADLPPRSQIQAIRIRRDPFAASAQGAGRARVEIITRPGTTDWEHQFTAGLRDQAIDARNAFAAERGEGQTRRLRWSSSGPLIRNRTSLSLDVTTTNAYDVQPIVATRPDGTLNDTVSQQNGWLNARARVEHALNGTHTLRLEYQRRSGERRNLGVGEFSLPERAYDSTSSSHTVRVSEMGTFGRRLMNESRLELIWRGDDRESRSNAVTVDVANAFTAGGAQLSGGTREFELELGNDLEIALSERHKVRVGFEGELGRMRSDRRDNAAGRFFFPSLEAFQAGRPLQFVQRVGEPSLSYSRYELAWYVADELRPRSTIQIGLGLRHEIQSFVSDRANFSPRGSIAWTPQRWRHTTLRAGAGIFHSWYDAGLHEQTLRLDGRRQRDLIVMNPGWPDPFAGGGGVELPPPSVVRAAEDLHLPRTRRVSLGVEQRITPQVSVRVNAFDEATANRLRSLDVNAPVAGVRPDPSLGRVTTIHSIGRSESRGLDVNLSMRTPGRQVFGSLQYRYARALDDADGALALPADSADLAAEWGPASNDVRHRIFTYTRVRLPHGLGLGLSVRAASAPPYTIRTGFDDNADGVVNDRPAGVGRNSARGSWHAAADLRLGWTIGRRSRSGDDGGRGARGVEIYTQISNLLNRTNFTRYSGVVTSPFFGRPTAAQPARRMEVGLRLVL